MSGATRRPRGWWHAGSSAQAAERSPDMFDDRSDAGRRLAAELLRIEPGLRDDDVVVLGLPRGGVPVAAEVADALHAPLDVVVVRKLGVPWQPEVAMGAVGEGGVELLDSRVVQSLGISSDDVQFVRRRERDALAARVAILRARREPLDLVGRTAVVVDDGLATGSTARAACGVVMHRGASRVVLAAPVGPTTTVATFPDADRVVCVLTPTDFSAVGRFYRDFTATTDEEVLAILARPAPGLSG